MRILIGVDGSEAAHLACEFVATRSWPAGSEVHLLGVAEPIVDWTGMTTISIEDLETQQASLEAALRREADRLNRPGLAIGYAIACGSPARLLLEQASLTNADLVVTGSRRLGPLLDVVLGSVSTYLVDHSPCPVLVARAPTANRILLAVDGTPSSRNIPRVLASWGSALAGLPVDVMSVAPHEDFITPWAFLEESPKRPQDQELTRFQTIALAVAEEMTSLGWHAEPTTQVGRPAREIVRAAGAHDAGLIIMGSRGLGIIQRLMLGSVTHDVLLHTQASILVIRGRGTRPIDLAVLAQPTAAGR